MLVGPGGDSTRCLIGVGFGLGLGLGLVGHGFVGLG